MSTPRDGKLLTVEQIKTYLQVDDDADEWDDVFGDLIEEAEAEFELHTGNRLIGETETMYFNGNVKAFVLPWWPIKDGSVTVVDTQGTVGTTDDETYSTDYYRVDYDLGIIHRTTTVGSATFWAAGVRRWKVTWTGGMNHRRDWASVQLHLRKSIRDAVANVFLNQNPAAMGESEGGGIRKELKLQGIPDRVREVWDTYKRVF